MESDKTKAAQLYRLYTAATATQAEEAELRELLCRIPREELTPELRTASVLFGGFEALGTERISPQKRTHRHWRLLTTISIGIAAAAAVGLFFAVRPTVYGYIDGRPITDPAEAMSATLYFEQLDGLAQTFDIANELIDTERQ